MFFAFALTMFSCCQMAQKLKLLPWVKVLTIVCRRHSLFYVMNSLYIAVVLLLLGRCTTLIGQAPAKRKVEKVVPCDILAHAT